MALPKPSACMESVVVLLPALNEERTIEMVINEIPIDELERRGCSTSILVMDGNSSDRTKECAARNGVTVVTQEGRGKGKAVRYAFGLLECDYLFMLDADFTYPARHVLELLSMLREGHDVVLGSRMLGRRHRGAMSTMNLIGNKLLSLCASVLYGCPVSDVCTGMWGFRGGVFGELNLTADHFDIEPEIFANCVIRGHRIGETPIEYRPRLTRSKLPAIRSGLRDAWRLAICRLSAGARRDRK